MIDIQKIKQEVFSLPEYDAPAQFILQGVKNQKDKKYGIGKATNLNHKEEEYIYPLYNIPYTNSIMQELGLYRTRIMKMKPKSTYTWHADYTKRLHIPLQSDWEKCFMLFETVDGSFEVLRMEPNGNYYEVDTTRNHTAINASHTPRIHLVGLI